MQDPMVSVFVVAVCYCRIMSLVCISFQVFACDLQKCVSDTHLHGQGCQDALGMDEVGVAQVVQAILLEDLGASLEPREKRSSITVFKTI